MHCARTRANVVKRLLAAREAPEASLREMGDTGALQRLLDDLVEPRVGLAKRMASHLHDLPDGEAEADRRVLRHHGPPARELGA